MKQYKPAFLKARLMRNTEWYVAKTGHQLGQGVHNQLEHDMPRMVRKVRAAIKGMDEAGAEKIVRKAERNMQRLINEMIKQRHQIKGYASRHRDTIGEQTLGRALSKLCPLWPIC